jgi:DNA-binding response OmpR family regulator
MTPAADQLRAIAGGTLTTASDAAHALSVLRHGSADVVLVDLALVDDLSALGSLCGEAGSAYVVLLRAAVEPSIAEELVAQVVPLGPRRIDTGTRRLRAGPLDIDLAARSVHLDGISVATTVKEFDLLAFLAARPGRVFSRAELLRHVWQSDPRWQLASTVTEHVRRLRGKIERDASRPSIIRTVRGIGYRFDVPADDAPLPEVPSPTVWAA